MFRAVRPELNWGWTEVLLNKAVYQLELLCWSKTKDAQKRVPQNRPVPFMPPFMKLNAKDAREYESHDLDDIKAYLTKPRS